MVHAHESYGDGDGEFTARFDLGEFRYFAAGYVKLLIRARRKETPAFLPADQLAAWGVDDRFDTTWPAWRLLQDAAGRLAYLNSYFIPRCGSGGVPPADESTPIGRLLGELAFLVADHTGGPYHNQALAQAASRLERGEEIDWAELVQWDRLPQIRKDLDQLPHPRRPDAESSGPPCSVVITNRGARSVLVHGRPATLTQPRFAVIEALVDQFPLGLSKDELMGLSGHEDAVKILKRLAKAEGWQDAIILPGTPGAGGYRVSAATVG